MSEKTTIAWTQATWNPVRGCTPVSPGCAHCYARTFAERWRGIPGHPYEQGFDVRLVPEKLAKPLHWRKPRLVFVNSMSDLFHEDVPDFYIDRVWAVMLIRSRHADLAPHTFQVCTKRPERMRTYLADPATLGRVAVEAGQMMEDGDGWHDSIAFDKLGLADPHVWLGVTAEDQQRADERIPHLLATPAAVRFVSVEPMLGPVDLFGTPDEPGVAWRKRGVSYQTDYGTGIEHDVELESGIDWVIVGGESGPGARPMHPEWARSLRDQCKAAGVPYFFKQWGEWAPHGSVAIWRESGREIAQEGVCLMADGRAISRDLSVAEHRRRGLGRTPGYSTRSVDTDAWSEWAAAEKKANASGAWAWPYGSLAWMYRVGTKRAGHLLDGAELREWPEVGHG